MDIICDGNNGNGCFLDSCGHNCGCEGLKEFREELNMKMKRTVLQNVQDLIEGQSLFEVAKVCERLHKKYSSEYDIVCLESFDVVGYN